MSGRAGDPVNNREVLLMSLETLCPVHRALCDERAVAPLQKITLPWRTIVLGRRAVVRLALHSQTYATNEKRHRLRARTDVPPGAGLCGPARHLPLGRCAVPP